MQDSQKLASLVASGIASTDDMTALGVEAVALIKSNPDMLQIRYRGSDIITKNEKERRISYLVSDETPDRVGDIIKVKGWDLSQYKKNPVILWAHDGSSVPPIGRANNVRRRYMPSARLTADVEFAPKEAYEFADTIYQLASRGFIKATSVGFLPLETMEVDQKDREKMGLGKYGQVFSKAELMEISVVAVPANPSALELGLKELMSEGTIEKAMAARFFDEYPKDEESALKKIRAVCRSFVDFGALGGSAHVEEKGAKPPLKTAKAPADQDWDAAGVWKDIAENYEGEAKAKKYWDVAAYRVDDADPETRSAYKFPHHDADGKVVWHGVAAAMAALNGARGGAKGLSESDREGISRHLKAHYAQFEEEAPELRSIDPDSYNEEDPVELAVPEALDAELEEKSPACRQEGEPQEECVQRKIPELIEEEGMEEDQAVAVANSVCETACSEKNLDSEKAFVDSMASLVKQQAEQMKATRQLIDALSDLTKTIHRDLRDGVSSGGAQVEPEAATPDVAEKGVIDFEQVLDRRIRGFADGIRRDLLSNNSQNRKS